jgi:hypothetical protein
MNKYELRIELGLQFVDWLLLWGTILYVLYRVS